LFTLEAAREALRPIVEKVWRYCEGAGARGRTLTLKVKYADFHQVTRSRTGLAPFATPTEVAAVADALLQPLFPVSKGIRLLGVTLSSLGQGGEEGEQQLRLT